MQIAPWKEQRLGKKVVQLQKSCVPKQVYQLGFWSRGVSRTIYFVSWRMLEASHLGWPYHLISKATQPMMETVCCVTSGQIQNWLRGGSVLGVLSYGKNYWCSQGPSGSLCLLHPRDMGHHRDSNISSPRGDKSCPFPVLHATCKIKNFFPQQEC